MSTSGFLLRLCRPAPSHLGVRKPESLAMPARGFNWGAAAGLRDAELQLSREVTEAAARVKASEQRLALLVTAPAQCARDSRIGAAELSGRSGRIP